MENYTSTKLQTPVVLIIFKRPDTTERVFEAIRQAKPTKLFVIADEARPHVPGEAEKCAATRAIIDRVDWDCEVFKNYAAENMGCGLRVVTGISWVFENVEEAIFLEDDCLPNPTFFPFCEKLLNYYRHDERIMNISGNNFQFGERTNDSYYFSRYPNIWGWATWKRAWKYYDFEMKLWQQFEKQNMLKTILPEVYAFEYWERIFKSVIEGKINNIWSYQWTFACWVQGSLSITPKVNLVSNIGFGTDATNTKNQHGKFTQMFSNVPTKSIDFPLQHPKIMVRHREADIFLQKKLFMLPFARRAKVKLKKVLSAF